MKVMKKSGFLNSLETIHELRISPSVFKKGEPLFFMSFMASW